MDVIEAARIFARSGRVVVGGDSGVLQDLDPSTGVALVRIFARDGRPDRLARLYVAHMDAPESEPGDEERTLRGRRRRLRRGQAV